MIPVLPRLITICLLLAMVLLIRPTLADDDLRAVQREFTSTIKPLLDQHCNDCHSGDAADAGLDLAGFQTIDQLLNARKTWDKIRVRVAAKEMPPEDAEPLAQDAHDRMLAWIDRLLNSVDCTEIDPGRVTIRRLNRTEYRNTIRDLVGIEYQPADSFPGDDVGYGFDNIADVLSLPPLLMEKYLDAAEEICQQAIVDPDRPTFNRNVAGSEFAATRGSRAYDLSHVLTTNGTIEYELEIPESGKYQIQIRSFADQAGAEPASLRLEVDGKKALQRPVKGTTGDPSVLTQLVSLKPGKRTLGISFTNDFYDESLPRNERDRNLHVVGLEIRGPQGKFPPSHRKLIGKRPADPQQYRVSARNVLNVFMSRAYRRRATEGELQRLLELYDQARDIGDSYEASIRFAMQAVLVSPYFLYKIEAPVPAGKTRVLSDFELATSLSYFFWATMPDDELLRLASRGELRKPEVYFGQIDRLLRDPKANSLVENFVSQWLQLRHLEHFKPDPDLFQTADAALMADMATETKLLVADLIRQDASVLELLSTEYTFLNQRLAKHYGVEGIKGQQFRRVDADRTDRRGLLTHASVLTLTSNPTRTSPVKRGKWIMENLLGEEPPPPDPEAMQLEDQAELTGTLRQRMEQHRADPNCAVCHKVMDELGFALENYDAIGRWREKEQTNTIDAHGELPDGTRFQGPVELQATIGSKMKEQFVRCLVEKMLIYALGRGLQYYDECSIDKIVDQMAKNDYRFSSLIRGIATSDPFVRRRGPASEGSRLSDASSTGE